MLMLTFVETVKAADWARVGGTQANATRIGHNFLKDGLLRMRPLA
jgi:hypothetical protein